MGLTADRPSGLHNDPSTPAQWTDGHPYDFSSLTVTAAVGDWIRHERYLLTFTTPELGSLKPVGKKPLYITCVKVCHTQSLEVVPSEALLVVLL